MLAGGHQHLAAHMPAFLLGSQLIFEMHTRRAGFDERFGQLKDVERSPEPGLTIRHNRSDVMRLLAAGCRVGLAHNRVIPFTNLLSEPLALRE